MAAAADVGATIVGESFHRFTPQGVTGILAIAESHISIHTWPEYAYAAADIFSCGSSFLPGDAARRLAEQLECADPGIPRNRARPAGPAGGALARPAVTAGIRNDGGAAG